MKITTGVGEEVALVRWPAFDGIADVAVTTREGGVSEGGYRSLNLSFSVGDDPAAVLENRRRAAAAFGADPADFVFADQVHGDRVHLVTDGDRGRGSTSPASAIPGADILVTRETGVVLAVLVADCVPVVLLDPVARLAAVAHAGWRGTVARVASKAVRELEACGGEAGRMIAALGPAVGPASYEVGEEVAGAIRRSYGDEADDLLRPVPGSRSMLDLRQANVADLVGAGVPRRAVHLAGVTTGLPGPYFSHRREQPCGRFAALVRLAR